MLKTNRYVATFILVIFSFSIFSCGGGGEGGGGSTGTTSPIVSGDPTPPPPQTATTDINGQATFTTTQGINVNVVIVDDVTEQPISDVTLTYSEQMDNFTFININDLSEVYIQKYIWIN